jgi:hypothetical protein
MRERERERERERKNMKTLIYSASQYWSKGSEVRKYRRDV